MLSRRAQVDARPNRLAAALALRAGSGRGHLDLTTGNPTRAGLPYDAPALLAALSTERQLDYEPASFGLATAREAVAELWAARGSPVPASQVALTASTSEAYSFLFKLLCDPGDQVLVPAPSYPLFEHLARLEGVRAVPYPLRYDGAWHVDLDALRVAARAGARAVVTVTPNNPTGSYLKRDELDAIAALGLPIVSDEVFGAYPHAADARRATSALGAGAPLVFALDGLSKLAGLPQLKLAWIAVTGEPRRVQEALLGLELVCDTFLSPGAAVQLTLPALLRASEPTRRAILDRVRANHAALDGALRGSAASLLPVEGGWYAVVRLPAFRSEEDWVDGLLEEQDVLVQPGYFYDFATEPFVVVSLLTPPSELLEGARRLREHVAAAI